MYCNFGGKNDGTNGSSRLENLPFPIRCHQKRHQKRHKRLGHRGSE